MKKRLLLLIPILLISLSGCKKPRHSSDSDTESSKTIEIYATNDIHGAIMEDGDRVGLSKIMTYLNDRGHEGNTLLIDQGDTWQGSIYSNYNHGELITDVMNYIHYDARSVGNHDFDWGVDYLKINTAKKYNGYSVPVLAGNVYDFDFDTKRVGVNQQSEIGIKSVTYTLENGLKVGILGGIGESQITSITSSYTKDICFTNHIDFIKQEATHLKNDEHCDVIIASIHTGQEDLLNNGLQNYVDLVLCGHTHKQESTHEGNLYYSQSKAYTQSVGHITLTYDINKKDVIKTSINTITGRQISSMVTTIEPTIQQIVNSYNQECQVAADEVLATNVSGAFYSSEQYPNLMCRAIFDECVSENYNDVFLTYVNVARASNYSSAWTYADLYQAFPFDNHIYIANITGDELLREVKNYNYIYRNPSYTSNVINRNSIYKIAVIDYLYFHTNENRYYDYFPNTGGTSVTTLNKNYREILRDWLKAKNYLAGGLNSSDYLSSLWAHDRTAFTA